jgi:hypothetical protein
MVIHEGELRGIVIKLLSVEKYSYYVLMKFLGNQQCFQALKSTGTGSSVTLSNVGINFIMTSVSQTWLSRTTSLKGADALHNFTFHGVLH